MADTPATSDLLEEPASVPWKQWILPGTLLAALTALAAFEVVPVLPGILAAALAWVVLICIAKRDLRFPLLGPHFFYDLVRMARRGRCTMVRTLFLLVLFVGLAVVFFARFWRGDLYQLLFESSRTVTTNEMAGLAETFVFTILTLQNLAVLLLTPAYVAGAISEEREQRSLEMLFTSHLTDREIVLGKFAARFLHIGIVVLASLPILSLAQLLGGIDMVVLLTNFANTFLLLLTVASISVFISVLSRTVFQAVMTTYGVVLGLGFCLSSCIGLATQSPFMVLSTSQAGYGPMAIALGTAILLQGGGSGAILGMAMQRLRNIRESELLLARQPEHEDRMQRRYDVPLDEQVVKRDDLHVLPEIDRDPLVWKEMYLGGKIILFSPMFLVPVGSIAVPFLVFFGMIWLSSLRDAGPNPVLEGFSVCVRLAMTAIALLICLGIASRAAMSVVREKQQQTLLSILVLPVQLRDILKAKWIGAVYKGWPWALAFFPLLFYGICAGVIHPVGGIVLVLAVMAHAAFLASLGLYISIVTSTMLAAQMRMMLFLGGILAASFFALAVEPGRSFFSLFVLNAFNPVTAWYQLSRATFNDNIAVRGGLLQAALGSELAISLIGALLYALGAWLMWRAACRTFNNEHHRFNN